MPRELQPCGTPAAYQRHYKRGEEPCGACREAKADYQREYRTRLKTYLESQLEELGQRGSAAPVDSGANNDGGFNQFNRGNN